MLLLFCLPPGPELQRRSIDSLKPTTLNSDVDEVVSEAPVMSLCCSLCLECPPPAPRPALRLTLRAQPWGCGQDPPEDPVLRGNSHGHCLFTRLSSCGTRHSVGTGLPLIHLREPRGAPAPTQRAPANVKGSGMGILTLLHVCTWLHSGGGAVRPAPPHPCRLAFSCPRLGSR